ncbi:MAG TPA: M55 family metallopeptidase [Candidatus Brocadiia bacterium]|nr:M55 family metallopeptidase [Candidatus Brocadiia bacterium]
MKIFISADIEGATGVVHFDETGPVAAEFARARKWMTGDVNAAIEGAMQAGAGEIWVKDAHGNGRNILIEELRPEANLVAGWDALISMVQGLDGTFDALLLIGYHSRAGEERGILSHTMSNCVKELNLNGRAIGEAELSALTAGYHGVPTVFVAGDQSVAEELSLFTGPIPHAVTKYAMGRETGRTVHPERTREAIRAGVAEALSDLKRFKPLKMAGPIEMSVRMALSKQADAAALTPGVERRGPDEVACVVADVPAVLRMFRVMLGLAWSAR